MVIRVDKLFARISTDPFFYVASSKCCLIVLPFADEYPTIYKRVSYHLKMSILPFANDYHAIVHRAVAMLPLGGGNAATERCTMENPT